MNFNFKRKPTPEEARQAQELIDQLFFQGDKSLGYRKYLRIMDAMNTLESLSPIQEITEGYYEAFYAEKYQEMLQIVCDDKVLSDFIKERQQKINSSSVEPEYRIILPLMDELKDQQARLDLVMNEYMFMAIEHRINEIKKLKHNN